MYYLILDTSSKIGFVALFHHQTALSIKMIPSMDLSKDLMQAIESVFSSNGLSPSDIDFIACGVGPGSFTGTRIGIISAKALSYTLNIPVVDFCSLIAFFPENPPHQFTLVADAKTKQVYQIHFDHFNKEHPFSDVQLTPISSIENAPSTYLIDESLAPFLNKANKTTLNISYLSQYVTERFSKKIFLNSQELKPIYLKTP